MRRSTLPLAITLTLVAACAPKVEPSGTVSVHDAPFVVTSCHVVGSPAGIELSSADGARLELALSPVPVGMGQTSSGAPLITFTDSFGRNEHLGTCGSLTLTGEGYHANGKRAVRGHAQLVCAMGVNADLHFTGCL